MRIKQIIFAAIALFFAAALTGCASDSKQPGVSSSVEAVEHLLKASVDDDAKAARLVVPESISDSSLRENMATIRSYVAAQGGLKKISVSENKADQMGAEHFVELRVADSDQIATFSVTDDSDGIRVTPYTFKEEGPGGITYGPGNTPESPTPATPSDTKA